MPAPYQKDLAYVQATAFGDFARGAAADIVNRLRKAPIQVRTVVDAGCGAGILTRALTEAGFDAIGIDSSAELLDYARQNAPQARFVHGSLYRVPLPECDALVAAGESLTYHSDLSAADDLIRGFFRTAGKILHPGGMLIFDVIGLGEPTLAGRTWRSGEDWALEVETTDDQTQRILLRSIETFRRVGEHCRRRHELHQIRLFDVPNLLKQLESCGFATDLDCCYGTYRLPARRSAVFATRLPATTPA